MKISYDSFSNLKKKFADLLSSLFFKCNLTLQNINELMIRSTLFDLFEDNNLDAFMNEDNELIINKLLPNINIYTNNEKDIGAIYWSGIQYINLFLNYQIPLRQLFIVCPINEMVKRYDLYHEMNEIELCKDILKTNYQNASILKYYRRSNNLSVREVSTLTNIPLPTLHHFEDKNSNLFVARNDYLRSLQNILNIPNDCLISKTSFVPFNISLITNKNFNKAVINTLSRYFQIDISEIEIIINGDKATKKNYFEIGYPTIFNFNNKRVVLDESLANNLIHLLCNEYINNELKENLVF